MDKFIIEGGKRLEGRVRISGSKNAALPVLVSSLLADGWSTYRNIPDLADIRTIKRLLANHGAQMEGQGETLRINGGNISNCEAPYDLVRTMRASVLVLGPLVARTGKARVSLPGGCAIGARPINLHLKALEAMGAEIDLREGYVEAKAKRLKGARIYFDISTVGGTENILMAAALAKGTTRLENAAKEPEVVNLADTLEAMGAKIKGAGTDVITIEGVEGLRPCEVSVIPDRIEAGTFLIAAAVTGGDVVLEGCDTNHLDALILKLRETGITVEPVDGGLRVRGAPEIRSADVKTLPYPGFPTDLQAQIMALLAVARGSSVVTETIFENRFMHVAELRRLGADIVVDGHNAVVKGVKRLKGAPVMATDLRASASLVVAGLVAEGKTTLSRVYHIDRGYQTIEKKLTALGASIKRVRA
ncbi:MAG: UDP-N-acetylglucosamine 1-carboxyvinyltransferase [Pseudomonadota bacterium]|nr:UDP-N-acetylglucosamine 1-carboxyvinyltransferase [Syntrophobacterales bacterium]MDI9555121.1 UDP-N-acetylglucosamine 1-carboxyvinyltransferase [Pseudomonadota bacterium]NLX31615.1 UDP-N-acetylglucosamine 1-carboxyvinyltransferase [Deltaproteobacteria bacterium]HNU85621.1 UDP-N-acetylglucosamine 1-carboxyvinyltransferase [Syntrophales bacterium]HOF73550.1 UDP-N-acetylglucosamine 1-carboxyvinyltransferase [Syntrophales bacterium]